jgi:hypothetical protein
MSAFADPRSQPPSDPNRPCPRLTESPEELIELHQLCRDGRLYEVERWIQSDRPLQFSRGPTTGHRRVASALEVALNAGNHALVLLLLCNGYDPNLEMDSPLDQALRSRRWDLLEMLLEWGADPRRVCLSDLFDTYNSALYERFSRLGVNLTANHELAETLAYHTSNKPLFGYARRNREHDPRMQQELNIALVHHADESNEKGIMLCLWAGADPHAPAMSLRNRDVADEDDTEADETDRFLGFTAVYHACNRGDAEILQRLGPDPARDDFDDLYATARYSTIVKILARYALPGDVGKILNSQLTWITPPFGRTPSLDAIEAVFAVAGRWHTSTAYEIGSIRRSLLKLPNYTFVDAMKLLARNDHCALEILRQLGQTPSMRERMKKVGLIPSPPDARRPNEQPRPTRAREVRAKFGIEIPKPKPTIPPYVVIGGGKYGGREIQLDREALFDRVWSEPVQKLAKEWGLSDRGLAKACARLSIPVPPRGYWARLQNGQRLRRPQLPELKQGEAEVIIIRLPE